jgi:hypothetical protein
MMLKAHLGRMATAGRCRTARQIASVPPKSVMAASVASPFKQAAVNQKLPAEIQSVLFSEAEVKHRVRELAR